MQELYIEDRAFMLDVRHIRAASECRQFCRLRGWRFAAIFNMYYCRCGSTLHQLTPMPGRCNIKCIVDLYTPCGGNENNKYELYSVYFSRHNGNMEKEPYEPSSFKRRVKSTVSFLEESMNTEGKEYLGCFDFKDHDTSYHKVSQSDTVHKCQMWCRRLGFRYAASMDGATCKCTDNTDFRNDYVKYKCEVKCTADQATMCGGHSFVEFADGYTRVFMKASIYRADNKAAYVGCFRINEKEADMPFHGDMTTAKTIHECRLSCVKRKKQFSANLRHTNCRCGDSLTHLIAVVDSFCNIPCQSLPYTYCGGKTHTDHEFISVYFSEINGRYTYIQANPPLLKKYNAMIGGSQTSANDEETPVTTKHLKVEKSDKEYIGCFTDTATKYYAGAFNGPIKLNIPTIYQCREHCGSAGYSYSGSKSGDACKCSDEITKLRKVDESMCSIKCVDDQSLKCGGNSEIFSVYYVTQSAAFVGCYKTVPNKSDKKEFFEDSSVPYKEASTTGVCRSYCLKNRMEYSGSALGAWCGCSHTIDATVKLEDSICSTPCMATPWQKCGGPEADAFFFSVYYSQLDYDKSVGLKTTDEAERMKEEEAKKKEEEEKMKVEEAKKKEEEEKMKEEEAKKKEEEEKMKEEEAKKKEEEEKMKKEEEKKKEEEEKMKEEETKKKEEEDKMKEEETKKKEEEENKKEEEDAQEKKKQEEEMKKVAEEKAAKDQMDSEEEKRKQEEEDERKAAEKRKEEEGNRIEAELQRKKEIEEDLKERQAALEEEARLKEKQADMDLKDEQYQAPVVSEGSNKAVVHSPPENTISIAGSDDQYMDTAGVVHAGSPDGNYNFDDSGVGAGLHNDASSPRVSRGDVVNGQAFAENATEPDQYASAIHIPRGEDGIIPCVKKDMAGSFLDPEASWFDQRDQQVVDERFTVRPSGDLFIEDAQARDTGAYLCKVKSNDVNGAPFEKTFSRQVIVFSPPNFTYAVSYTFLTEVCDELKAAELKEYTRKQLMSVCATETKCTLDNFHVQCHFVKDQEKKRSENVETRSIKHELFVSFEIRPGSDFEYPNCDFNCIREAIVRYLDPLYNEIANIVKQRAASESNGPDNEFKLQPDSLKKNFIFTCVSGYHLYGMMCGPCHPGHYSPAKDPTCHKCEKGAYQPEFAQGMCSNCPQNGTTVNIGTIHSSGCKDNGILAALVGLGVAGDSKSVVVIIAGAAAGVFVILPIFFCLIVGCCCKDSALAKCCVFKICPCLKGKIDDGGDDDEPLLNKKKKRAIGKDELTMIEGMARDREHRRKTMDLGNGRIRRHSSGRFKREGSGRRKGGSQIQKPVQNPNYRDEDESELMYDKERGFYHNNIGWWDSTGDFILYNESDLSGNGKDSHGYSSSMPNQPPPPPPQRRPHHY